jgi:fructosamine-3-kinase
MQTGLLCDSGGGSEVEFFFKSSSKLSGHSALLGEFRGIEEIYSTKTIRVPRPVALLQNDVNSFAIFEKISFNGASNGKLMARQLAAMHSVTSTTYGFHTNNTIGATFQPNTPSQSWADFYVESRLKHVLQLCKIKGADLGGREPALCSKVHAALRRHEEQGLRPSLLHGDLWSGNWGWTDDGPVIFDCSCYYGDSEVDLAMMSLFGSPPGGFTQEYARLMPLRGDSGGFERRKSMYNLYHMLNHFVLFGGSYLQSSLRMVDSILSF